MFNILPCWAKGQALFYTKQRILSKIMENEKIELIIENNYSFFSLYRISINYFFTPCGSRISNCARQAQP